MKEAVEDSFMLRNYGTEDGNLYKHLKKEELLEKLKQLKIDEENNTDVFKKWKDLLRNEKSEK